MITEGMTRQEIFNHWLRDKQMMATRLKEARHEWKKRCKKYPKKADFSYTFTLNCRVSRQEYYAICIHDGMTGMDGTPVFAKVAVGRGFNYYELTQSNIGDDIIVYTSHFLDRYQERMKVVGDRRHVLTMYRKNNQTYHRIHSKNKYCVYAMRDGLALAIASPERTTFVTFVSYDMLKPSQKAAFDKVRLLFRKDVKIIKERRDEGYDDQSIINMLHLANADMFEGAETLYDMFFQDKIPTDITEGVKLTGETQYIDPQFDDEVKKFKV